MEACNRRRAGKISINARRKEKAGRMRSRIMVCSRSLCASANPNGVSGLVEKVHSNKTGILNIGRQCGGSSPLPVFLWLSPLVGVSSFRRTRTELRTCDCQSPADRDSDREAKPPPTPSLESLPAGRQGGEEKKITKNPPRGGFRNIFWKPYAVILVISTSV